MPAGRRNLSARPRPVGPRQPLCGPPQRTQVIHRRLPRVDITRPRRSWGFYILRAIFRDLVDASRVTYRDGKTYFSVPLDDSNRRPICRLWFNSRQKYVGPFDAERNHTKEPIDGLEQLYVHADAIRARVGAMLQ